MMNSDIKINLKMHLYQFGSIAYAARELALALARQGCTVKITDIPTDLNETTPDAVFLPGTESDLTSLAARRIDPEEYWHLRFTGDVDLTDLSPGRNIFMYPWDFDPNHGHTEYLDAINNSYDAFWAMSNHTLNAYVNIGVHRDKSYLVPHGINCGVFHPDVPPKQFRTKKGFKFLFTGLPIRRKGIDLLLRAYCEEFSASDDVCLVFKTKGWNPGYLHASYGDALSIKPEEDQPEIAAIFDEEPMSAMPSYYTGCDCFVLPTRGESFGLAIAEAMACAKPVITTRWGGATDFCRRGNSYLLDYQLTETPPYEIKEVNLPEGTLWADPDREQLKRTMRDVYENRDKAREVGLRAHQDITRHWTWDHAAERAISVIRRMNAGN